MKFFIFSFFFLVSYSSYADTCVDYFNITRIARIEQLSEKQYNALENLAHFEINAHKEENPHLKRSKILELEDLLSEAMESGIDLQVYYEILQAVLKNESGKYKIILERIRQQAFEQQLEQTINSHFNTTTLTEALFKAFQDYNVKKDHIDLIFSHRSLINQLDVHQTQPPTPQEISLANAAKPNSTAVGSKKTLLHFAAEKDRVDILQYLLEQGADIEALSTKGLSPIFIAAQKNASNAVDFLWKQGAQIDGVDGDGNTLLHFFAQNGNDRYVEKFLSSSSQNLRYSKVSQMFMKKDTKANTIEKTHVKTNTPNKKGLSPFQLAVKNGHYSAFKILLNNGGDLQAYTSEKQTLLHLAVLGKNFDIFRLLKEKLQLIENLPYDITDIRDVNGRTVLHLAAESGLLQFVEFLSSKKSILNTRDESGRTPLALSSGKVRTLLLQAGAKE